VIPQTIRIKNGKLPNQPGVYLMKDAEGAVIYVGKATSLKKRVNQYFDRPHDSRIGDLVRHIRSIDYHVRDTALEALILEANLIKYYWPKYNVMGKDNKSFLYLAITKEDYPRPLLVRGTQLDEESPKKYRTIFGPYTSPKSLRAALDLLRKVFSWTTCTPGMKRPCFYYHLKQCPGVCVGAADKRAYQKTIRDLIKFFEGKKDTLLKDFKKEMKTAAKEKRFEDAAAYRNKIYFLEHIQDVAILKRENGDVDKILEGETGVNLFGRIEGYDVSNISGTMTVASMVVFLQGAAAKAEYRKFRIRTVQGPNDVASLRETLMRRFRNPWKHPDLILVDGGIGQVNIATNVLRHLNLAIPVIGMAKGPDRKKEELVCTKNNLELCRLCEHYKDFLVQVRDEAHRFAVAYHRKLRSRRHLASK
jgi:excinuclease ABC subunit C